MKRRKTADKLSELEARVDADGDLNAEQRDAIKERARKHVQKKRTERLTDELFAKEVRLAEVEFSHPDDEIMEIVIDLPEFTYMLTIDNVGYYHGLAYDVPRRKYMSMVDLMARAWEQDREIHGRRRKGDVARDPLMRGINQARNTNFSMNTGRVTSVDSMRQSLRR